MNKTENNEDVFSKTFLVNDYFSKNREKYTKKNKDDEIYKSLVFM